MRELLIMSENNQVHIFITGAGQGAGLAAVREATRRGHKVTGTTSLGTVGANRIRRAGGLPVYPDLARESALYSAIMMSKADVVINAAPQALSGIPHYRVNYEEMLPWLYASTEALLLAAGRADVKRIVHLSSAAIYGATHEAATEDAHLNFHNALLRALDDAEDSIFDGGMRGYVLRTGAIYGSTEACAAVIQKLRTGQAVPAGHHKTSWVNEEDVASAALQIAEIEADNEALANVYNIADDEPMSPDDFIDMLGVAYGIGEPVRMNGLMAQFRTSEFQRELLAHGSVIDSSKAKTDLNWQANVSKAQGIEKMLLFWRAEEAGLSEQTSSSNSDSKELAVT
jgi:nucleoside-diphosphate-sugar epimerase